MIPSTSAFSYWAHHRVTSLLVAHGRVTRQVDPSKNIIVGILHDSQAGSCVNPVKLHIDSCQDLNLGSWMIHASILLRQTSYIIDDTNIQPS